MAGERRSKITGAGTVRGRARSRARMAFILAIAGLLAPLALADKASDSTLVQIRLGGDMTATRLVFDLSADTEFTVMAEENVGAEDVTRHLVVTLPALATPKAAGRAAVRTESPGRGLIRAWQRDPKDPKRFLLELTGPVGIARYFTLAPAGPQKYWRAVIDLVPSDAAAFRRLARKSKNELSTITVGSRKPRPAEAQEVSPVRPTVAAAPIVVLDAGHGGKDPGATGVSGGKEKDVVLKTALELHDILRARGYDVRLTRDSDAFLSLTERVTYARSQGADLFISVHADSADRAGARGASVYTLSEPGTERAHNVRLAEDWVQDFDAPERPREVAGILLDLTRRDTKNRSALFARILLEELGMAGPILANSHRNAGFFVLLAPDVPAVLLEMGFLSNAEDEARLMSASGRKKIVLAAAEAVDRFFADPRKERRVASRDPIPPAP